MSDSGKDRFVFTKSYEIAYALFRIAGTLQEKDFAERLRGAAGALLGSSAVGEHQSTRRALQSIECFVKFAGDVNLLAPANADTILREVYLLDAAVVERINSAKSPANGVDLSEIFSHTEADPVRTGNAVHASAAASIVDPVATPVVHPVMSPIESLGVDPLMDPVMETTGVPISDAATGTGERTEYPLDPSPKEHGFMRAEMRQDSILERIRQSGNCRLKDIQEILPGCSERTIRYDLQALIERNLIERMGAGGPSVTYRMRQNSGGPLARNAISGRG